MPLLALFASNRDDFFALPAPAAVIFVALLAAVLTSGVAPGYTAGKGRWAVTVWAAGLLSAVLGVACGLLWLAGLPGWLALLLGVPAGLPGTVIALRAEGLRRRRWP